MRPGTESYLPRARGRGRGGCAPPRKALFALQVWFLFPRNGPTVRKEKGGEGSLEWPGKPDRHSWYLLTWSQSSRSSTWPKARESSRQLRDKVRFHPEGTSVYWGAPSNTFNLTLDGGEFLARPSLSGNPPRRVCSWKCQKVRLQKLYQ